MADPPISDAKIFTTLAMIGDKIDDFQRVDTIEYQGKFWLVPRWFGSPIEGWRTPELIICLENLPHRDLRGTPQPADFGMNVPIPRAVLDDLVQGKKVAGYEVIYRPPVRYPIPTLH